MSESNTSPDVVNVLTSHDKKFVLRIYAYRRLTALEMRFLFDRISQVSSAEKNPGKGRSWNAYNHWTWRTINLADFSISSEISSVESLDLRYLTGKFKVISSSEIEQRIELSKSSGRFSSIGTKDPTVPELILEIFSAITFSLNQAVRKRKNQ